MKHFEINTNYYNQEISSIRKREWIITLSVLILYSGYSFYTKQDLVLTILLGIVILILFPLKIKFRYNKYSFYYKIIFKDDKITFHFLHPFYTTNLIKEFKVNNLNIKSSKNNSLCTILFSTNSDIYIKNLFEIQTHISCWKTEQLLEIKKLFNEAKGFKQLK